MRLRRDPVTDALLAFRDDRIMVTMAPRIRQRLIEAMVHFDDPSRPIAETYRSVGAEAERLGLTRPSYQRIRELVHQARNVRPRLSVTDVIRIVTTLPKNTDHGLELLSELGVKPIALWGLSSERPRPP